MRCTPGPGAQEPQFSGVEGGYFSVAVEVAGFAAHTLANEFVSILEKDAEVVSVDIAVAIQVAREGACGRNRPCECPIGHEGEFGDERISQQ